MFKNEYQSAAQKISVSDAWRAETLAKMQATAPAPKKNAVHFRKRAAVAIAAAITVLVVPAVYYGGFFVNGFAAHDESAAPFVAMPEAAMMAESAAPFAAAPAGQKTRSTVICLHGVVIEATQTDFVLQADDGTEYTFSFAQDNTALIGETVTVEYTEQQGAMIAETIIRDS